MNKIRNRRAQGGFTLIELAIVLAITSLLTVGLWRMMSSGNAQMRDQAAADQHKLLISAVRGYLANEGQATVITPLAVGGVSAAITVGPCAPAAFCNYLPTGFTNLNSYNQTYQVRVRRDTADSYSFMIKTTGGETIPDTSGGRISSAIGGDGGFVYDANVCGAGLACGAFGTWTANPLTPAGYNFPGAAAGQVASRTFVGVTGSSVEPWLARTAFGIAEADGFSTFNKLHTNISLNGMGLNGNAAATWGGDIFNLGHLEVGRGTETGGPALEVSAPCDTEVNLPTGGAGCDQVVSISGDVGIVGLVNASALFAARYIYNTSDARLKKDIKPIENALDKVAKLVGYSFVMKNTGETKYGIIAQEVEEVFPENVLPIADGYKGVDYMGMIGPLVAAVRELKEQNEAMKAEIDQLKKEVAKKKK